MTEGAAVGAVVAVIAWLGLFAYLRLLSARLDEALRGAGERVEEPVPTVQVVEVERDGANG